MRMIIIVSLFFLGLLLAPGAQGDVTITGAGATFPYPCYSQWAYKYYDLTKVKINYQPVGSGAGIAQIKARTVNFAGSDIPLQVEELRNQNLLQFPMLVGGIVPIVNISDISRGDLHLTPEVLADIFLKNQPLE